MLNIVMHKPYLKIKKSKLKNESMAWLTVNYYQWLWSFKEF